MTSTLIYGCMGLGGDWDAPDLTAAAVDEAEAAILAALEAGITTFDLADIYRRGKSERAFGEVLRRHPGLSDTIVVQTKVGITLAEPEHVGHYDLDPGTIRERTEACLDRLGLDRVDTLLLHRPDPLMTPASAAAVLDDLVDEGLVAAVGVSNFSSAQMAGLQRHLRHPVTVDQLEMSLHHRGFVEAGILVNTDEAASVGFPEGTVEHCVAHDIELQAWGSLAQGRYSGRLPDDASEADRATADLVGRLADGWGTTGEAVVLAWLLRHPAGIRPVIGTADPGRIAACAEAEQVAQQMTREQWYALLTTARGHAVP